jgi:Zn-dependent M28 family amino/carboxypeptidase
MTDNGRDMTRASLILLVALTAACTQPVQHGAVLPTPATASTAAATIQPRDFHARIGFLASDALQGRDTPSQGLEAAAAYISSEFYRAGLRPAGTDGYLQRWPYSTLALDPAAVHLEFRTAAASRTLVFGQDYYVAAGSAEPFSGGIVFASRQLAGDAEVRSALRDRAVAVYMPELSQGAVMTARNAADAAGAAALVVLLGPAVSQADIARSAAAAQRPTRAVQRLPVFFVRHDRARQLLADGGLDFDAATGTDAPARASALTGVTAFVGARPGETRHMPPNVVGVLPGSDPALRGTYVVFSAHFDHVGVAGAGSWQCTAIADNRICNGADDNASGTAAILELAHAYAALPEPPRRSLVFLAVSGEEKGLLGSAYYADNPTVPIDSIVANINLDMLGRNHPDSVVVIGQTYSSLGPLLHQVNDRHPELAMTVSDDLWPEQRFFYRSDHFSFARREVPALFFFTGVHEDYHRPTDTVDRIDLDKITRITRLVFHYGMAIANDAERPAWDAAGLDEIRRLTAPGR